MEGENTWEENKRQQVRRETEQAIQNTSTEGPLP